MCCAYARHNMLGLIDKIGKSVRIVWDASTQYLPTDLVLNMVTPTEN